jgi:hypothetical protein
MAAPVERGPFERKSKQSLSPPPGIPRAT